VTYKGTVT